MKIYIGFSYHKNNMLSNVIKTMDGTSYSHVYIRRESKYGEYVYQASGLAVNFTNVKFFLDENIIVEEYEFELPDDQRDALMTFFIKYVGAKYQLSSLFKLLAILGAKRLGIDLKLNGDGDKRFICSELGAVFCEQILNIDIPEDEDFITPKNLNPYVSKYGKRVI